MAKTSSLALTIKAQLADDNIKNVPEFAVTPAKKSLDLLAKWKKVAESCIAKRGHDVTMDWGPTELDAESKNANERTALLRMMLDTARKHA